MNHTKSRLLIADNHRLVGEAFKNLLEPEFEIMDVVTNGRALMKAIKAMKPDGVILEVFLPHLNGFDATMENKRKMPSLKLIFATANSDPKIAAEAFRHGASAFVLKQSEAEEFKNAIRTAMRGESYLSPLIARETVAFLLGQAPCKGLTKVLSPRQAEILQLLSNGRSMKQISEVLEIAPGTVAFHKYTMMRELGISSNAELLQYAITQLITPI